MSLELQLIHHQLSDIQSDIDYLKEVANREEDPIDISEASKFLRTSEAGIRFLISKKRIPYHLPAKTRKYKFFKSELIDWIRSNNQKSHPENR